MENKLILNLRMEEIGDQRKTFSLMNLVFRKIRQLESWNIKVEYFELRLHRLNEVYRLDEVRSDKEAYMKIDANDRTFIDSEISLSWEAAIMNSCDRLKQRFLGCDEMAVAS